MTWRQFIEWLEKQIAEGNIKADEEIWYIDISYPHEEKLYLSESVTSGVGVNT